MFRNKKILGAGVGASMALLLAVGACNRESADSQAMTETRLEQKLRDVGAVELSDSFTAAFSLRNMQGQPVSEANLKGGMSVLYLGFTHCTGICNAALALLSDTLDALGEKASLIKPVFIGVDPMGGDTPATMRAFLEFDDRIAGYSGTPEQTGELVESMHGYVNVTMTEETPHGYDVNHSSLFYVLDRDAKPVYALHDDVDPQLFADFLAALVRENEVS